MGNTSRPALSDASSSSMRMASQAQVARASCPSCGTQNEFTATVSPTPTVIRCGSCTHQFSVSLLNSSGNSVSAGSSMGRGGFGFDGTSVQLCRNCGTINSFPTPAPGQPTPDVVCGACGTLTPGLMRVRRHGTRQESRLGQNPLLDHSSIPRGVGPWVRVNVGGHRRVVPLALLLALMAEEADRSNPAQAADIAALPTRTLGIEERLGEQTKCLICLDEFGDGDDIKTLPCLHIYHQKCIERWLGTDNSCPVCKTPIDSDQRGRQA